MWTPIGSDHTFIMIDPLGLGFFDATFLFKVPGAPPKKKLAQSGHGKIKSDSPLAMTNTLGLRFFWVIIVTTVPGVPEIFFGKIRPREHGFLIFVTNGRTS